ncbi:MAG: hypothetical protein M3O23_12660 [Actinomycetota bacterium]|nr:hypothetical protein [Actinomycetota bacterium]
MVVVARRAVVVVLVGSIVVVVEGKVVVVVVDVVEAGTGRVNVVVGPRLARSTSVGSSPTTTSRSRAAMERAVRA